MPYAVLQGKRIHYQEAGGRSPLVLMHGNAGSARVWRKVIPGLAQRHRVIAFDRQGFGESDKDEDGDFSPRGYVDEWLGLLDALSIERAHLAGLSFGGMVAQCAAIEHPDRVAGLVLVGTTADRTGRDVTRTLAELARDGWPAVAERLVQSWFRPESDPSDLREAYEIAMQSSRRMRELTVEALGRFDIRAELPKIKTPTLVLVGAQDVTCPLEMAREVHAGILDARLVVIADCAHLVPVEQPDALITHMLEFLHSIDAEIATG